MRSPSINAVAITLLFFLVPFVMPPEARAETSATRVILQVEGMTCEKCAQKVTDALLQLNGVSEARVNLDRKQADVAYASDLVSTSDMREAIEQLGFRVTGEQHADSQKQTDQGHSSAGCCQ